MFQLCLIIARGLLYQKSHVCSSKNVICITLMKLHSLRRFSSVSLSCILVSRHMFSAVNLPLMQCVCEFHLNIMTDRKTASAYALHV
jgi:hypothetical protein